MINWLTIAVIGVLLFEVLSGWKKGLVRMVFSFAISIVTLIIIWTTAPYVEQYVKDNTSIYQKIETGITAFVQENLQQNVEQMTQTQEESAISNLPIPKFLQELLIQKNPVDSLIETQTGGIAESICHSLTDMVFRVLVYVVMFFVISIAFRILLAILDVITKVPGIHLANAVGGAAFGLLNALVFIWILCMLVTALASTKFGADTLYMIKESPFLSFIYNNNLLLQLIAAVL